MGEIDVAVRMLTSARASSLEAMGAVCTSPSLRNTSTAGQLCAPAEEKKRKVRHVHLHGGAPSHAGQLCAPAEVSAGSLCKKKEPEGNQDTKHTISERTLSEIVRVLKTAERHLTTPLPGGSSDESQAKQVLSRVLDGADEARVLRSVRALSRLSDFTGAHAWEVDAPTLCSFLLRVSQGGPTAAAGVWHQLDWWR